MNRELEEVRRHRALTRDQRSKNPTKVAAIVGYTNAGKSSLLNALTNAGVLQEDKLFATLDPITRALPLSNGQEILLTDTVGFIRKLPHHLIEAFRSTLEEAKYADYIIHVTDAANPQMEKQMHIVYETLEELGVTDKKSITLFNKMDLVMELGIPLDGLRDGRADKSLRISVEKGMGLTELKETLESMLREENCLLAGVFPYSAAGELQNIRRFGELLEEEYREDGIWVKAFVPKELFNRLSQLVNLHKN